MAYNDQAFKLGMELSNAYLEPQVDKSSKKEQKNCICYFKIDFFDVNYSNSNKNIQYLIDLILLKLEEEIVHYSFESYENNIGTHAFIITKKSKIFINTFPSNNYISIEIYVNEDTINIIEDFINENIKFIEKSIKKYKIRSKK